MSFSKKIKELLNERFGNILTDNYIKMVKSELGIKSLDKATEKEQEKFVFSLINKLYKNKLSPQDLKKQVYIIFYKLFGAKRAMETFGKTDITIQPITFVYFVFGKVFGEYIIDQCEKIYSEKKIRSQDEYKQVIFVKKLLNDVFVEFPEEYRKEINLRFLIFLKFGENPEKDILKFLNNILSKDNYEASFNMMESILNFFGQNSGALRRPNDMEMHDMASMLGLQGTEVDRFVNALQSKMGSIGEGSTTENNSKGENIISDVRSVLASVVGSSAADEIISSAEGTLGVKNIDKADSSKKKIFYDLIMSSDVLALQSFQKRLIVQDKLRSILL
ncbi:MAG: hypothetical protein ACOCUT_02235 [bacterium]